MNLYESLAVKIEEQIRGGILAIGERLPSIRHLGRQENASPATVVGAYDLLKSRGLIEARERSGFYVAGILAAPLSAAKAVPGFVKPASLDPEDLILSLRQAVHNPRIFPFGTAAPMPDFFPIKALNRCVAQVMRDEPATVSEYRFPPGAESLRQQLRKRFSGLGVNLAVDDIVTTSGAIDAIGLALSAVARPGDVIAVETPTYFGILQLVRALGYKILEIPLDTELGLTPQRFHQALQKSAGKLKALITVVNFCNPLGSLVTDAHKQQLVQLAADAGTIIIEDDIYGDLAFDGTRPKPLKAFDIGDTVILCGSFAKTISPALRVGFACSRKFAPAILAQRAARVSGVSALAEEALALYLESGHYERHLRKIRSAYHTLTAQYTQAILSHFPKGTRVSRPAGGFVLWVELPGSQDVRLLQAKALEKNISVAPGPLFSSNHKEYGAFIRINCAIPWTTQAQKAVEKLGEIIARL
jgi:DNA-binding transcriptional MocR family regulator